MTAFIRFHPVHREVARTRKRAKLPIWSGTNKETKEATAVSWFI